MEQTLEQSPSHVVEIPFQRQLRWYTDRVRLSKYERYILSCILKTSYHIKMLEMPRTTSCDLPLEVVNRKTNLETEIVLHTFESN